ncbi:MAG TPA: glycosyltransferase [Sediminibacterium sp.]|nr:glycosyltransferase [Sediminibacterium sp.]
MPSAPQNFNRQRILVAPLDWGLGHATRCIPLIHSLLALGHTVFLAGEGAQAALLQESFPALRMLPLPGYHIRYTRKKALLPFKLLLQLPGMLVSISQERRWLRRIIPEYQIDLVIADNRYGLYDKRVSSVIITHQLCIQIPWPLLQNLVQRWHYRLINRFTACWVPDTPGSKNLGGDLSHPAKLPLIPVRYIGLLSRLVPVSRSKEFDFLVLLSGPEPQRFLLEQSLRQLFQNESAKVCWVRGLPGINRQDDGAGAVVYNHLPPVELAEKIAASKCIICRSGYSSLMDLARMKAKAVLIPTPGQTEQTYLAKKLSREGVCLQILQHRLPLSTERILQDLPASHWPEYMFFSEEILSECLQLLGSGAVKE